jgi:non-ribosomal peptide synthetase component E (peptide arylation enzyme)
MFSRLPFKRMRNSPSAFMDRSSGISPPFNPLAKGPTEPLRDNGRLSSLLQRQPLNVSQGVLRHPEKRGENTAIVFEGHSYSFMNIDRSVAKYALLFNHMGVRKGDRVAIMLPKGMEFLFCHLAKLSALKPHIL